MKQSEISGWRQTIEVTEARMDTAFPADFIWGTSTAAYQIEGAHQADGKGRSIWDVFSHTPGKVEGGDTGDDACDHYHRYREDVRLLQALGVSAYRFSTAWTRIFPEGGGRPNLKGRDFYERLIDALLKHGISPWLCFYHWDLPQALQDKGGWTNRDIIYWFSDYAAYVAEYFGDRVGHFIMFNEPNVASLMGHLLGIHAPGLTDFAAFTAAAHHFNLATGVGLERLRSLNSHWQLGTVLNLQPVHPKTDKDDDHQAAQMLDAVWNRLFLDPLFQGCYPPLVEALIAPQVRDGDLAQIQQPLDFLGVNLYSRTLVRADMSSLIGMALASPPKDARLTAMGWEVYPDALLEQLMDLKENYANPTIYITENGAAFHDTLDDEQQVQDVRRIHYLRDHLLALAKALEAGVNVKGYFVWSLLDNFEWAEGYAKRFGLVYVNYATQERIPKASYHWFKEVIASQGLALAAD